MDIRITDQPLSLDAVYKAVVGPEFGGIVLFAGSVRSVENGSKIESIRYEAYDSMARKEFEKIVRAAEKTHGARIAVHHRTGRVPVGESSVLIAAAAGHRPEAFTACREVIDRLKKTVPIWKASFEAAVSSPV